MPRSRGSELPPQRASPRAPLHLKTTASSDSNAAHHRSVLDRTSPKLAADRHSPRSPLPEKKRAGTRVAELETKLGKVQDELKKLREQLVSAEAAKKDAQVALEEAKKHVGTKGSPKPAAASPPSPSPSPAPALAPVALEEEQKADDVKVAHPAEEEEQEQEESSINSPATDVFEVVRTVSADKENQAAPLAVAEDGEEVSCGDKAAVVLAPAEEDAEVEETKAMIEEAGKTHNASAAAPAAAELNEIPEEVAELRAQLAAREMEVAVLAADNAELKKLAADAAAAARTAEEDAAARAFLVEQELRENAAREARMGEQLRAADAAREALDAEMRRLRVQTEQWRKAAEAAAAVIGGDAHLVGHHGLAGGNGNGWGSPATMPDDGDEEGFGGKRKGGAGGIRMLGDLWKKKGTK
ncbi:interactor of constitutive active ROPs 1-like [Lolium rigidum]|uniref:interactor of constitutive active ROPs 1-like n=1 Tax=Lolium rigidum TaxID=89674 RepID=UPI001F5D6C5E|nr:interactor of constitutive active ROPs 1-like [Lolium rigidum]